MAIPDFEINTVAGETVKREMLIAYLNTGTSSTPVWSPIGKRVEDSSMEFDWSEESFKDILGNTFASMKKPIITQTFDPSDLDAGDEALQKIWKLAAVEQNAQALCNMDMLVAHFYTGSSGSTSAPFGERYESCMVKPTGLGGAGGGNIGMPFDVTFGGTRTIGTVSKDSSGAITFTAAS